MPNKIYMTKNYEIVVGITRLNYLSNASRITPISDLVREISLFQVKVTAQSGIWEQFQFYPVFEQSNDRIWESGLNKSCRNFVSFPTM